MPVRRYHPRLEANISALLPAGAHRALERAAKKPLSFAVRYLVAPGPRPRLLVVLGEAHVKLGEASASGRDVVRCFELRGVETFQRDDVAAGRALGHLIDAPRHLLRAFSLGAVKGSTITDAKEIEGGHTVELERSDRVPLALHAGSVYLAGMFGVTYASMLLGTVGLNVPVLKTVANAFSLHLLAAAPAYALRDRPWAWMLQPAIAILTARDELLAQGTVRMLRDHPGPDAAVVVMGRAHVAGYARALVDQHGFAPADL